MRGKTFIKSVNDKKSSHIWYCGFCCLLGRALNISNFTRQWRMSANCSMKHQQCSSYTENVLSWYVLKLLSRVLSLWRRKKEVSGSIEKVKNIIKEEVSKCEDYNKGTLLSVFAMFELVWCETVSWLDISGQSSSR